MCNTKSLGKNQIAWRQCGSSCGLDAIIVCCIANSQPTSRQLMCVHRGSPAPHDGQTTSGVTSCNMRNESQALFFYNLLTHFNLVLEFYGLNVLPRADSTVYFPYT